MVSHGRRSIVMNVVYDNEFTPNAPVPLNDCEYLNVTSGIVYYRYETIWTLITENFYGLGDVTRNESSIKTITFSDPGLDYLLVDKAMDDAGACTLSLTEVHMRVAYNHVEASGEETLYQNNVTFRIWFPDEVDLVMSDYYFDAIAGMCLPHQESSTRNLPKGTVLGPFVPACCCVARSGAKQPR
jgi:hypothetical protein